MLRLAYIAWTPFALSPDEAHYWDWSRRLDFSYYSKGPVIAWVIAGFTSVFGVNAVAVRIGAALFSALTTYALYLFGKDAFKSEKIGFYSAVILNTVPIFSAGSALMTPDMPFVFFWTASIWCVYKALSENHPAWWLGAGALTGAGFLSKYTMALILPCVLLTMLFTEEGKKALKSPWPYVAATVALLISTPVIYWNILHEELTIKHTLGQINPETNKTGLRLGIEFFGSQLALVTPILFVAVAYGIWTAAKTGFKEKNLGLILAFFTSAPVFLFFFFKGFHGKVQGNWAAASYITAAPAALWILYRLLESSGEKAKKMYKLLAFAGITIAVLSSGFAYFPWVAENVGYKTVLYGAPYNRVTAWRELGNRISKTLAEMPPETFIMADSYQITSELAFYVKGNPTTYNYDDGNRRMNQYDLWPGPESLKKGRSALYVKGDNVGAEKEVLRSFEACSKDLLTIYRNDAILKEFSIWRCYNYKGIRKKSGHTKF